MVRIAKTIYFNILKKFVKELIFLKERVETELIKGVHQSKETRVRKLDFNRRIY